MERERKRERGKECGEIEFCEGRKGLLWGKWVARSIIYIENARSDWDKCVDTIVGDLSEHG